MSAIEELLVSHPAVSAAATMSLPDATGNETPSVFITVEDDQDLSVADITTWAREHCEADQLPHRWLFINQMPTTADGQIDHRVLRALIAGTPD